MTPDALGWVLIGVAIAGWLFLLVLTAFIVVTAGDRREDDWREGEHRG